jgi:hypothetical protein
VEKPQVAGLNHASPGRYGCALETQPEGGFVGKRRVIVSLFPFMLGLFPLFNSLSNPRLSGLHGSDVLQLIASGFCFGIGFGLLLGGRSFRGE